MYIPVSGMEWIQLVCGGSRNIQCLRLTAFVKCLEPPCLNFVGIMSFLLMTHPHLRTD